MGNPAHMISGTLPGQPSVSNLGAWSVAVVPHTYRSNKVDENFRLIDRATSIERNIFPGLKGSMLL